MKVFLVEDSALLLERLEALVASIDGARMVGHAAAAREAVEAILASQPDVVVLDIHLKEGTGFDVMRKLRDAGSAAAVLVLTNYPMESYRASAERLGARGFFDKSNDIPKLRAALAERAGGAATAKA